MKPRMLILLVVAAGLGIYFATKAAGPGPSDPDTPVALTAEQEILKIQLNDRELAGEEPAEEAEFSIRLEVDPSGEQNRIFYYLTESHGFYVETFNIDVYHVAEPGGEPDEDPLVSLYVNDYVKANETFRGCFHLVPAELKKEKVGGEIGTTENWYAEVVKYGRARAQNPDPLPPLANDFQCR